MPTLTGSRAGFDWDGDWEWVNAFAYVGSIDGLSLSTKVSGAWRALHGDVVLPWIDVTSLPGWDPSWSSFAPGAAIKWSLGVGNGDLNGDLTQASVRGQLTW